MLALVRALAGGARLGERQLGLVAGSLDRLDEPADVDRRAVELDARRLGGVVDARGDAVELVQLALDAIGAGGARHARDRQLDAGAHRATSRVNSAV